MEKTIYEYLCRDLQYLGFGRVLFSALKQEIANNMISFELPFECKIDNESVIAILDFTKLDATGNYYFTGYQISVGDKLHYFKIFKGKGITVKEAFNLLSGRAVFKQFQGKNNHLYNEWIQLDLNERDGDSYKQNVYYESWGYDLSAILDKMPVELPSQNWDRPMLIKSLQKGNLQMAFLSENGAQKKVMLEANPKEKIITVHHCEPTERKAV